MQGQSCPDGFEFHQEVVKRVLGEVRFCVFQNSFLMQGVLAPSDPASKERSTEEVGNN